MDGKVLVYDSVCEQRESLKLYSEKEMILVTLLSKNLHGLTTGLSYSVCCFGSHSGIPKSMPLEIHFLFHERNFVPACFKHINPLLCSVLSVCVW